VNISKNIAGIFYSTLVLVFLVSTPRLSYAISSTYAIYFDENATTFQHADWVGRYTLTDVSFGGNPLKLVTEFFALIGNCSNAVDCTYDSFPMVSDPAGNNPNRSAVLGLGGDLGYFPAERSWTTFNRSDTGGLPTTNGQDLFYSRLGVYTTSQFPIPEASALFLLSIGAFIAWAVLRGRRTLSRISRFSLFETIRTSEHRRTVLMQGVCFRTILAAAALLFFGACAGAQPLSITLVNEHTGEVKKCAARESKSADIAALAGAVETCAKQLEARGYVRTSEE